MSDKVISSVLTSIPPASPIQADFDRIALLSSDEWDHNSHYHSFLLKHIPPRCTQALEIGCGTGATNHTLPWQKCARPAPLYCQERQ